MLALSVFRAATAVAQRCRRCLEPIESDDRFGRSEEICRSCR